MPELPPLLHHLERRRCDQHRNIVHRHFEDLVDLRRVDREAIDLVQRMAIEHQHGAGRQRPARGAAAAAEADHHHVIAHQQAARIATQVARHHFALALERAQHAGFGVAHPEQPAMAAQRVRLRQPGQHILAGLQIDHAAGATSRALVAAVALEPAENRRQQPAFVQDDRIDVDRIRFARQLPAPDFAEVAVEADHAVGHGADHVQRTVDPVHVMQVAMRPPEVVHAQPVRADQAQEAVLARLSRPDEARRRRRQAHGVDHADAAGDGLSRCPQEQPAPVRPRDQQPRLLPAHVSCLRARGSMPISHARST